MKPEKAMGLVRLARKMDSFADGHTFLNEVEAELSALETREAGMMLVDAAFLKGQQAIGFREAYLLIKKQRKVLVDRGRLKGWLDNLWAATGSETGGSGHVRYVRDELVALLETQQKETGGAL